MMTSALHRMWTHIARLLVLVVVFGGSQCPAPALAQAEGRQAASAAGQASASTFLSSLSEAERAWLRAHPVIRVAQDPSWPPIEFADSSGAPSGMTADYLTLIEARLGLKFERVKGLSWQDAYAQMKRWEIDMTTTVAVTEERETFWAFTKPYMTIPIVIVTRSDVTYIADLRELEGKKVAVVEGYVANTFIARDFPGIELVRVPTTVDALRLLQRGEVFASVENMLVVGHYLSELKITNLKVAGNTPYTNAQRMAVRKDWAPLAAILDRALDSISQEERNTIYRRWLPVNFEYGFDYTRLLPVATLVTILLLGLVARRWKQSDEAHGLVPGGGRLKGWHAYLFAISATASTFGLRLALDGQLGGQPTLVIFTLPIMLSAYLGGLRAGLLATAVTFFGASYFLLAPIHSFAIASGVERWQQFLLVLSGVFISGLSEGLHRSRRRAELATRQHREAKERLLEREAVLADAQRIAHIGSWYWDARTGTTTCSQEMCRIFGREAIPPLAEQGDVLYPMEDWQRVNLAIEAAARTGTAFDLELPALAADGRALWVGARAEAVRSAVGEIVGLRGTVQDITDRKRAEANARRLSDIEAENRQIQVTNRLKSQFLANMSHELRTPLNAVIGFADLLHSGFIKPDSPKHQEFLGHIGTSGRHLLQLINDVLDLSKIESGKFEFFPEPIDLPALLKEVKDILQTAIKSKGIEVETEIDPSLVDLTLDPARLKQVLYNYLSNAIKFTAAGGRVIVRATAEGPEHFRIEVEDTGIGISAADLPRLFTEFQQLDAGYNKQHQGTGLGLALTRRLVQAQGGQVGVRSTVGVGSVFSVVLNRTDGWDTQRAEAIASGALEREVERVLVIEDDLRDQSLLVEALSQAGFEVDAAADSPFALRRARETAYAALTLDLSLPGRRGLELLDDIRSQGASHASPVVGVTMPADLNNSAAFAIANVLCKPIRSEEISSAMARFRLRGERRANVMVIDDEQVSLDLMRATLMNIGIDAVCFQDGRIALQEIDRHRPDAIVLDLTMPAFDGFQVLDALQRLPAWREVPVFIWTSMLLTDEEYATLARSARAILIKGGGAMETVLDSVRRWRRPMAAPKGAKP